jgi:ABC-type phosphate transport system substrate-binding protein
VSNAPDAVTTATSEAAGGTSSTSTTTTVTSGQDDDVVAAALEGFFTPVSERVAERFEQQSQNTSSPYLFVPEGQAVSVFVNGVLEVAQ